MRNARVVGGAGPSIHAGPAFGRRHPPPATGGRHALKVSICSRPDAAKIRNSDPNGVQCGLSTLPKPSLAREPALGRREPDVQIRRTWYNSANNHGPFRRACTRRCARMGGAVGTGAARRERGPAIQTGRRGTDNVSDGRLVPAEFFCRVPITVLRTGKARAEVGLMKRRSGSARPFTPVGAAFPISEPMFRTVAGANCYQCGGQY